MYWDVIEVRAEPNYSLFVRFKDGLHGYVRLQKEDLTGVLSPLKDMNFFEKVFIDRGAIAWPGEIDLAPDTMHAEVARHQIHSDSLSDPARGALHHPDNPPS